MCGRFTRNYTWAQLHRLYSVSMGGSNLQPRYNIFPTTTVDAVVYLAGTRQLVPMRWGIIPNWWSKPLKDAMYGAVPQTVKCVVRALCVHRLYRLCRTHCSCVAESRINEEVAKIRT